MPATPVPASTVILLRDATPSPEVLIIQRSVSSEFLPDLYVFPGGRVDEGDHALADRLVGASPEEMRERASSVDAELAAGFFAAAIRETFEEVGVLLARRRGERELVGEADADRLGDQRLAIQSGDRSFREFIEFEDLDLAVDRLRVHGHWVTPEMMPKRFDTLFFTAAVGRDQRAMHDGFESTNHVWLRPEDALVQSERGERQIILPTRCNLETVAGFANTEEILEASGRRSVVPVLPRIEKRGEKRMVVIRKDAGYTTIEEPVPDSLPVPGPRPDAAAKVTG